MKLNKVLHKRYACKQMNGKKIAPEKLNNILEAIRLAPTSMGLQPFEIFVVDSQKVKDEIFEVAAPGQPQIPQSSEVIIFAVHKKLTDDILNAFYKRYKEARPTVDTKEIKNYVYSINNFVDRHHEKVSHWTARQAYIALGFGLIAAANEGVDAVPIEGYNPSALDEYLELDKQNLQSVCMMAVGYSNKETDYNRTLPKIRKSKEELFKFL